MSKSLEEQKADLQKMLDFVFDSWSTLGVYYESPGLALLDMIVAVNPQVIDLRG